MLRVLVYYAVSQQFIFFVQYISFFVIGLLSIFSFFFFNDTATTEIYTLSLHDALPICSAGAAHLIARFDFDVVDGVGAGRSEEHTSELQSQSNLVCRLLLEKKKK